MAAPSQSTLAFIEYLCLFFGISGALLLKIDQKQPKPYMDEIFHIPQAQKYCRGEFYDWDPMITTLPGLYLSSIGIYGPMSRLLGFPMKLACSTFWLRGINVVFAIGNALVIKFLLQTLGKRKGNYEETRVMMTTIALSVFPLLYFFTFLYYTDSGSTFCVLLMYLMALQGRHLTACGIGVVAVLFRQTNIVWVVFTAGIVAAEKLVNHIQPEKKDIDEETQQSFKFLPIVLRHMWNDLRNPRAGSRSFWFGLISLLFPYSAVCAAFVAFVIWNDGIVVGARNDHQVSTNFPQLFYFASFTACFAVFHIVTPRNLLHFGKFLLRKFLLVTIFAGIAGILIWKFTCEHRFILADNRHYTFYVWHKVYRRHEHVKFALIPGYLFAWWSIFHQLRHQNFLWKLIYFVCVTVTLVPQALLEFRYFLLPYLIFRLHSQFTSYVQVVLEMGLYLAVNAATLYLFMEKPFTWPNDSALQRFMW